MGSCTGCIFFIIARILNKECPQMRYISADVFKLHKDAPFFNFYYNLQISALADEQTHRERQVGF